MDEGISRIGLGFSAGLFFHTSAGDAASESVGPQRIGFTGRAVR